LFRPIWLRSRAAGEKEDPVGLKTMMLPLLAAGAMVSAADASVIWMGSGGSLAAQAEFSLSGSDLVVTLTNTSLADVMVPSDVLTAMFFDISGSAVALTRTSGLLAPGSSVFYDPDGQPAGGVVGGEWAYRGGMTGAPGNRAYGISSTGINLFGPGDLFPGPDLCPPITPDGLQYGILSAGDNTATGNSAILNSGGLIKNSVIFTLGGAGANFDLSRINNVLFFYGTSPGEGSLPGQQTPAPGALALIGLGGALCLRRRR
jgi:MYXO-CTERM domain-containing protein